MPTSSQALILQTTNGHLPPVFGRHNKKPALPSGPEWSKIEYEVYPMSNMYVMNDEQSHTRIRKHEKQQVRPPPRKRTESAPALTYKLDSATVPKLLRIRGIHGTLNVDQNSNSIRWKVNSIGPFYEQREEKGQHLPRLIKTPSKFHYFHADRMASYWWDEMNDANTINRSNTHISPNKEVKYHQVVRTSLPSRANSYFINNNGDIRLQTDDVNIAGKDGERWYHDFDGEPIPPGEDHVDYCDIFRRTVPYEQAFVHRKMTENSFRDDVADTLENPVATFHGETSDQYFNLVPARFNDIDDMKDMLYATFELEKCSASETGAFRLLPTIPGEYGDFKLKPSIGIASDRFRLFSTTSDPDKYILLESAGNTGVYKPMFLNRNCDSSYQKMQTGSDRKSEARLIPDVVIPREAWVHQSDQNQNGGQFGRKSNVRETNIKHGLKQNKVSINKYDYFDEITKEVNATNSGHFDVNALNSIETWNRIHGYKQADLCRGNEFYENNLIGEMLMRENQVTKNNGLLFKQHTDTFNEQDVGTKSSVDNQSRNPLKYHENKSQVLNNKWIVSDFDQWSRTTPKDVTSEHSRTGNNSDSQSSTKELKDEVNQLKADTEAVLNDVKYKASYKLWKKRKISTMRMRKVLPPSDPNAVCVKVDDNTISHDEMKHSIEAEIGCKLISLQFDPILADSFQGESKYRWILRFANSSVCDALALRGIHVNGIKRSVRRYDDVMKEEHDVYNFHQMMKNRDKMVAQKTTKKVLRKLNEMSTTEAQTTT